MDSKKLDKIRRQLEAFQIQGGVSSKLLVKLAKALGCKIDPRGKEPTYVNELLPDLLPVSIPNRKDLAPGTKANILDSLEGHVYAWQDRLEKEKADTNGQSRRNDYV
jgi:hypothetical protein